MYVSDLIGIGDLQ